MPNLRADLEVALGARYTVERELGGGGMSRVFLVRDTTLDRRIVVKLLHPALASAVSAERFRREIAVAAQLQHPQLVPLLDAGELGELPWYSMPYVEGESLRSELRRRGALPVGEAVRVLLDITRGLAYAHQRGVIHRDVKPENILLNGSSASLADFGVARAVSLSSRVDDLQTLTSVGAAIGTPRYMAPEQAQADPAMDHRADLYALGVVALELLTGDPTVAGRTLPGGRIVEGGDPSNPDTPGQSKTPAELQAIVCKLLEARPVDRYQSAGDVLVDLEAVPISGSSPALDRSGGMLRPRSTWLGVSTRVRFAVSLVLALLVAAFVVSRSSGGIAIGSSEESQGWEVEGVVFFRQRTDTLPLWIAPFADRSADPASASLLNDARAELNRTLAARQIYRVPFNNAQVDGAGDTARVWLTLEGTADSVWARVRIVDRPQGRERWDFVTLRHPRRELRAAVDEATDRIAGWAVSSASDHFLAGVEALPPRLTAFLLLGEYRASFTPERAREASARDERWILAYLASGREPPDSIARRDATAMALWSANADNRANEFSRRRRALQAAAAGVREADLLFAELTLSVGRPREALSIVEGDSRPGARLIAANALAVLGRFAEAESLLVSLPTDWRVWVWTLLAATQGDAEGALRRIREQGLPVSSAALLLGEAASVLVRTAPQLPPDSVLRRGMMEIGIEAAAQSPDDYSILARLYLARGDVSEAMAASRRAEALLPADDTLRRELYHYFQAQVAAASGDSGPVRRLLARQDSTPSLVGFLSEPYLRSAIGDRAGALAALRRHGKCCGLLDAPSHYETFESLNGWPPYETFLRGQPDDAPARSVPAPKRN